MNGSALAVAPCVFPSSTPTPISVRCTSMRLTTGGFDVAQAADGRDALTKALVRPPNLLVMELGLPLIDGFAFCEILRWDRITTHTPILIVHGRNASG